MRVKGFRLPFSSGHGSRDSRRCHLHGGGKATLKVSKNSSLVPLLENPVFQSSSVSLRTQTNPVPRDSYGGCGDKLSGQGAAIFICHHHYSNAANCSWEIFQKDRSSSSRLSNSLLWGVQLARKSLTVHFVHYHRESKEHMSQNPSWEKVLDYLTRLLSWPFLGRLLCFDD
jgi:hypothetical protein